MRILPGWKHTEDHLPLEAAVEGLEVGVPLADLVAKVAARDGAALFALVDAAGAEGALARLAGGGLEFESLFAGRPDERFFSVSPILIRCEPDVPPFTWLAGEAWRDGYVILLTAKASLHDLAAHFRKMLEVEDEHGRRVYFRFYDPRVLRVYLPTCTAAERAFFLGPAVRVLAPSETADTVLYYEREGPDSPSLRKRLALRPEQFAEFRKMMRLRFVERMEKRLRERFPDEMEEIPEKERGRRILGDVERAEGYGIVLEHDVQRFLDCTFLLGADFDRDPERPRAGEILNRRDLDGTEKIALLDDLAVGAGEERS